MGTNFLTQLMKEPTARPLFVNKEGLVGDVLVSGHLGHNDHEI